MNPFRKIYVWYLKRKLKSIEASARRDKEELAKTDAARVTLQDYYKGTTVELGKMGFETSPIYSTESDFKTAVCPVVGPNKTPYRLTVNNRGGFKIESI